MWHDGTMPYEEPHARSGLRARGNPSGYTYDERPARDDPEYLLWLLWAVGWSPAELARRLKVDAKSATFWANGRRVSPAIVIEWLEDLARYHAEHRQPPGWREG